MMKKYRVIIPALIAVLFVSVAVSGKSRTNQKVKKAAVSSVVKDTTASEKAEKLGEVVVSSMRVNRKLMEVPASMSISGALDYKKNSAFTVANVLNSEPGIAFGGDGVWSTNVVVRGLGESRLVTLIDGDRVETASDLTASLSMIDVNNIERVEVIKGAQSSLYGSGALGGIINVITKQGDFAPRFNVGGGVTPSYSTVNKYFSNNVFLNFGDKKWYLRVSDSYGKAHNIKTPDGKINNSGFKTNDFSASAGFRPFANQVLKVQYQRNWSNDVGIPGGSAFPGPATASYKKIGRALLDVSYEFTNLTDVFKSLKFKYYNQYIIRNVEMTPNTSTTVKMPNGMSQVTTPNLLTPHATHKTNGGEIVGTWKFSDNQTLVAGVDLWRRNIKSSRVKYVTVNVLKPNGDTLKTNHVERGETPLPTASFTSAGAFAQDEMHFFNNKLTVTAGARLDEVWIKNDKCYDVDYITLNGVRTDNPATQRVTFDKNSTHNTSWSANLGAIYKLTDNVDAVFNAARSFRVASLEERYKYIDLGNYVRLGNPNLKSENGYSFDLGLRVWGSKVNVEASVFMNRVNNLIVEEKGSFIYTLATTGKQDTIPAMVNANVDRALLYGFDFKADYNVIDNLVLSAAVSYVRGKDTKANTSLPQIPPFNARLGARYTFTKLGSAELAWTLAAKQSKIAAGETETAGYGKLDFAVNTVNFRILHGLWLQVFAGIDNLTNNTYTNHLSTNRGSISVEPGRNFYARACFTF
jgi:hemoglobin/transferrin/lactoferrin receptor protein